MLSTWCHRIVQVRGQDLCISLEVESAQYLCLAWLSRISVQLHVHRLLLDKASLRKAATNNSKLTFLGETRWAISMAHQALNKDRSTAVRHRQATVVASRLLHLRRHHSIPKRGHDRLLRIRQYRNIASRKALARARPRPTRKQCNSKEGPPRLQP